MCSNFIFSQYEITIEAYILDQETKAAVPYVNIGFLGKGIGTVTDENGKFTLIYDEDKITLKDKLQISALAYQTIIVSPRQLIRLLTNTNKIYLKPQAELLDEVLLTGTQRTEMRIGHAKANTRVLGYRKDKNALGGEIATRIKIDQKNTQLLDVKFHIVENNTDSLKIRMNVYNYKRGYHSTQLLKQNVLTTIKQKDGEFTLDLRPYRIEVDDDIVVSIELVKVYGDTIEFAVSGERNYGMSFKRYVSHDDWEKYPYLGMNFSVLTSVVDKKGSDQKTVRPEPKKITLYWDSSLNMEKRQINEELSLLKAYLNQLTNVSVQVIKVYNKQEESQTFEVRKGKNPELYEFLKTTIYEGASSFESIARDNKFQAESILVFTDGKSIFKPLSPQVNLPIFIINSMPEANHEDLQRICFNSDGHYINLAELSYELVVDYLIYEIPDRIDYANRKAEDLKALGKVFSFAGPIQGAEIRLKNTFIETLSDVDGHFEIKADINDILVVNYLGMLEKEAQIIDLDNVPVLLKPEGELIDEVLVEGQNETEDLVETPYGDKDKKSLGYAINYITADEIGPQYTNLADLLVGRFAGLKVAGLNVGYGIPKFIIRGGGGSLQIAYAMFDIDGIVYSSNQNVPNIDVQTIESIAILKSTTATNRYGSLGQGGAIVIKTKTLKGAKANEIESALIKGNDYLENEVRFMKDTEVVEPAYLKVLEASKNYNEAKTAYLNLKDQGSFRSVPFYMDSAEYFMKWDKNFAYTVLSNIAEIADENPKALRALAFKMEALGRLEDASHIYERIAQLTPYHEQPYRDLARIYAETAAYKKAMDLYRRMLANAIEGVEFIGLKRIIENELMHLLAFHRSKVDYSDIPNDLRAADFKYDLRIVFDWNNSNTEFELQFVNPQNKYFTWSHTKHANKERVLDEIKYGYASEEFIIDDADPGSWIINIENLSDEPLVNPTYLKYTVYKNFGLPDETKVVKVIKLYQRQTKVTLDKFRYE